MACIYIRYGRAYWVGTTDSTDAGVVEVEWNDGGTWASNANTFADTSGTWANRSDVCDDPDPDGSDDLPDLPAWRPPTTAPPDVSQPVSGDAKPVEREWCGRPSQPRPPPRACPRLWGYP